MSTHYSSYTKVTKSLYESLWSLEAIKRVIKRLLNPNYIGNGLAIKNNYAEPPLVTPMPRDSLVTPTQSPTSTP